MPYVPRVLTNGTDQRTPASVAEDTQLIWEGWYPLEDPPPTSLSALDSSVAGLVGNGVSLTRGQLELYFESYLDRTGATPGQVLTLLSGGQTAWQDPTSAASVTSVNGQTGVVSLTAASVSADPAGAAAASEAIARLRSNHTGTQLAATISDLTETVQDIVAAFLVAGTNVTVSYNDVANTFTINSTGGGGTTDAEVVRDTIGGALVAGAGITITVNDAGDTITIASTAVLPTRQVNSGTGLSGGGDLSANRTLAVTYGSTAGTAVQGNDARVTADQAAGTASIRTLGTTATSAKAGNYQPTAANISDATTFGRALLTATDDVDGRTELGVLSATETQSAISAAVVGAPIVYAWDGSQYPIRADTTTSGRKVWWYEDAAHPLATNGTTAGGTRAAAPGDLIVQYTAV